MDREQKEHPPSRVVIVDDNKDGADLMAVLLQQMGHDVYQAYDGPSGISLIHGCRPHLVLLDLVMPEMSGFDVIRTLRANRELKGTAIIALTGLGRPQDVVAALAAGFNGHIVKPASIEVLTELMRRHCTEDVRGQRALLDSLNPFVSL